MPYAVLDDLAFLEAGALRRGCVKHCEATQPEPLGGQRKEYFRVTEGPCSHEVVLTGEADVFGAPILDSGIFKFHLGHHNLQKAGPLTPRFDQGKLRRRGCCEHQPRKPCAAAQVKYPTSLREFTRKNNGLIRA